MNAWLVFVLAIIIVPLPGTSAAAFAQDGPPVPAPDRAVTRRTVLAIHWGPENFPSTPVLDRAIRETLASRADLDIDYFTEYLESDLFADAAPALTDYIRRKYSGKKIDLVITVAEPAQRFVLDHREELFPDAPIVTLSTRIPDDAMRITGNGLTGITQTVAQAETLKLALSLHPTTEEVFVVANGPDAAVVTSVRTALLDFSRRVRLTYLTESTLPSLLARIKDVPPRSLILYVWHSQNQQGRALDPVAVSPLIAAAAPVPVYGTSDLYVGTGVVGGVVRGTRDTGIRIGEMALRILGGTPARDIPIETARVRPVFDWRELRRWRIDERRLPEGSIVSFRGPSLWRDYRPEVLVVVGVVVLLSILIVGLVYQRRARRRAEVESRRNLSLAADANRRMTMSALTGSIAHDLSQPLNSILHNVQAGEMLMTANRATPETLREILADIQTADVRATEIVERHRTMLRSHQIDTKPIDIHTVVRESVTLVAHDTKGRQLHVDVDLPETPCIVTGDRVLLQQVVVNLLMNAMDAMAETPVERRRITVQSDAGAQESVTVSVRDAGSGLPETLNGRVFEPFVTTKANGMGIGLTIVHTIVEAHRGRIEARNNAEGGATFAITLPCDHRRSPHTAGTQA